MSPLRSWKRWLVISMNDGWVTGITPGYRTKTIKVGNCTVEINRPILDAEEMHRREEAVRQALRSFGKEKCYG